MAVFRLFAKSAMLVTSLGGASVVSTSGFLFPVGHDLNRSMCSSDFLGNAYFRSKVGKQMRDLSF